MDGVDAESQCFLQLLEDVGGGTGAGDRALSRDLVQQLLEALKLNQQYHVLQEEALNKRCEFTGTQELSVFVDVHTCFRGDVLGADDLTVSLKGL